MPNLPQRHTIERMSGPVENEQALMSYVAPGRLDGMTTFLFSGARDAHIANFSYRSGNGGRMCGDGAATTAATVLT